MRNASLRHTLIPFTGAALSAALLLACGKKEEQGGQGGAGNPPPAAGAAESQAGTTLEISGNDQMQFSTKSLSVKAGEPVTLIMKNAGSLPVQAMGHDWVLLQAGASLQDFSTKAGQFKDNGYIPTDSSASKMLAHTKLLGPGEADTIKFTAPPAGQYPYLCTFPGHYATMSGVLESK